MTPTQIEIGRYRACVLTPGAYASYWPKLSLELDRVQQYWSPWWTMDFIRRCQLYGVSVWECGPPEHTSVFAWTQVVNMPAMNVFQIALILGNSFDQCLPQLEACFERAAQVFECEELEILGRRGWGRKLGNCREIATVFRRKAPTLRVQ